MNDKYSEEVESIVETNSVLEEDTNYEVYCYFYFYFNRHFFHLFIL